MEQDTFILTLPAIAEAMKRAGVTDTDIMLGVGLPIDSYGTQKEAFRRYFLQNVSFEFEGTAYRCRISDCKVFAQGHAALCRYYPRLQEYRSITLVDIGGYTVDVLTVHNFKLERASCVSLRLGTIILYSRIQDALQKSGILLSDALITDAIRRKIQHTDSKKIEETVEYEVSAYCKELLNALRERGLDLRLPTVFAGGGAELLESRLRGNEINIVAVLNRFANADGYKLLLG